MYYCNELCQTEKINQKEKHRKAKLRDDKILLFEKGNK